MRLQGSGPASGAALAAFVVTAVQSLLCSAVMAAEGAATPSAASAAASASSPVPAAGSLDDRSMPPLPGPPRPLAIAAPTEQRLPNGLRVVLAERPGVRLVTAQLVVLSGSEVDPPRRAGLASMAAGLLTRGTVTRSATQQAREAESLGGTLDSGAGWNQSQVGITVAVDRIEAALDLLADAVRQPAYAAAEIARLRAQALDGLKVAYGQPGTLAALAADRLAFGGSPYGHPADGTRTSLPRITRADLVALHRERFRPDHAVLVLAGDLDPARALQLAQRHFGRWQLPQRALPAAPEPAVAAASSMATARVPGSLAATAAAIDMPQADQAAVVVQTPLPPLGPDRATAAVLNAVLGADFSSRLNQEIRINRGLSYGVGSQLDARPQGGALRVAVQTKNASADEVVQLVQTELDRLIAEPVPADELAVRKAALIGSFGRGIETTAGLASALRALIVAGVPVAELRNRIAMLQAVGADDVQRYAAAHLGPAQRRVVVAGKADAFAAALLQRLPAVLTVSQQALDLERDDGLTSP
jgi:zinc protease